MNAVFTICSTNFLRHAIVMLDSVAETTPNIKTFIFLVDKIDTSVFNKINIVKKQHMVIPVESLSVPDFRTLAFKYSLTELNTAIKPSAFRYLFENGTTKAIYFDPDILVYEDVTALFGKLETYSAVVTPHIISDAPSRPAIQPEYHFRLYGIMNLGFIAVNKDSCGIRLLAWWEKMVLDGAFEDRYLITAYDQKWADYFHALFGDRICTERHPGYNVASWNLHERELVMHRNRVAVRYGEEIFPLVFYHFSGYKTDSKILNWRFPGFTIIDATPIHVLVSRYNQLVHSIAEPELDSIPYGYGFFSNNQIILPLHRRFYRQLKDIVTNDPFNAKGPFYHSLSTFHLFSESSFSEEIRRYNESGKAAKIEAVFKWILRGVYALLGLKRYLMLLHAFYRFSKLENNAFLIENKLKKYNKKKCS
jgi:hypothetical protein